MLGADHPGTVSRTSPERRRPEKLVEYLRRQEVGKARPGGSMAAVQAYGALRAAAALCDRCAILFARLPDMPARWTPYPSARPSSPC
jgi:hypothetical protein